MPKEICPTNGLKLLKEETSKVIVPQRKYTSEPQELQSVACSRKRFTFKGDIPKKREQHPGNDSRFS